MLRHILPRYYQFCSADKGILLCTDVAARGLDIPKVDWIVQWHGCSHAAMIGGWSHYLSTIQGGTGFLPSTVSCIALSSARLDWHGGEIPAADISRLKHQTDTDTLSLKLIQMCCSEGTIRRMNPRRALKLVTLGRLLLRSTAVQTTKTLRGVHPSSRPYSQRCQRKRKSIAFLDAWGDGLFNGMASVSKPDTCMHICNQIGTTCYFADT